MTKSHRLSHKIKSIYNFKYQGLHVYLFLFFCEWRGEVFMKYCEIVLGVIE